MLNDKCAVVTGSTSGIGLGMARALAAQGCHVMLNGFGEAADIERVRRCTAEEFGVKVLYSDADLAERAGCVRLIEAANEGLGRVDVLVNNAGIQHTAPLEEFPAERWDKVIAVNLSSAFHASAAVLPQMRARDWGRIINTASTHGLVASVHKAAYVAAKHGILGLTKVIALETAETGITCNAICPGWVRTELVERQIVARAEASGRSVEDEAYDLLAEKQPSRRFVTPEQLGAILVFLCSDAAAEIRGAALPVDGGWTAQ